VPAAQRPATFVWSDEPDDQVWIESFLGWGADGLLRATVVDLRSGERSDILLAPQDEEFVLRLPEGDSL
jgi:hypothetical protein